MKSSAIVSVALGVLIAGGLPAPPVRVREAEAAGVSPRSSKQSAASAGVTGTVLLGPRCPVVVPGMEDECADTGYAVPVVARRARGGPVIGRVRSGTDGGFRLMLPPGDYRVTAVPETDRAMPSCAPQDVTVAPGAWVSVTLQCDTGIR